MNAIDNHQSAIGNLSLLLRDVLDGLRAQPMRLLLAMGTMATGVATLTVLFGILAGLDQRAEKLVSEFGADTIGITPTSGNRMNEGLPPAARDILRRNLEGATVSAIHLHQGVPIGGGRVVDVIASDHNLSRVRAWPLIAGREFDPLDIQRAAHVCLLTRALADELHVGVQQFIALANMPLRIVGIISPSGGRGSEMDSRLAPGERFVLVPETLPPLWIQNYSPPPTGADALFIKTGSPAAVATMLARARQLLQGGGRRMPACSWTTPDMLLGGIRKLRGTISLSAGAIATLCLLLGGATLTGLMLSRIQERIPEIGLRRSLGASRADIAALCVLEALLISLGAALLGILTPLSVLAVLNPARLPIAIALNATVLLLPILVVAGTAVLASLWPALVAARISPYEALRND